MAGNRTLTIIKPDAVEKNLIGEILQRFIDGGFRKLTEEKAKEFYKVHADKPFYNSLVAFMTSGPVVAAILEKDNAVEDFRKLIGATNPEEAEEGTIRKDYAESIERNCVHGSDADDTAQREGDFFFSELEKL
ncbi:MAG: nucleoside-diphosphate kinase [Bacteroidetes bacterium SW_11_45_7]|nr:MAG: nucleoside-diphosphate kinase [Bacteroidetes bacterium SW_11_45_7]